MVVVAVRIQHDDRQLRKFSRDFLDVTDAHASVELQGALLADDEVSDGLFGLMRLVDRVNVGRWFVDFKPWIADADALERLVFGTWKCAAPVGGNGFVSEQRSCD